ncbi:hypothetical protein PHYC_03603 [Phycisphaerales bacterium]|nr:hypothetical protein PHYC_03603 [Phycisphaerales bacterium]
MIDDLTTEATIARDTSSDQTRRQLEVLFEDALELRPRPFFHVATLHDIAGRWFDSIDDAVEYVEQARAATDVYVCAGLRFDPPRNRRGERKVDHLDGVVGVVADLDVKDAKKKTGFESIEDARDFAESFIFGVPPTMLIRSGGGLQALWLFKEPLTFDGVGQRVGAITFFRRFGATIREAAKSRGVVLDSVHDLVRLFRVAGTFNRKIEGNPRPTFLERPAEDEPVRRYEPDDLEAFLIHETFLAEDLKAAPAVGFVVVAPDRSPPADALEALLVNHDKARGSWDGKRPDLADQTPSSFDFSLATIAISNGWADQEVVDLLIAGRRHRGDDLKTEKGGALRLDYYQRTLAKAKAIVQREKVEAERARREAEKKQDLAPEVSAPLTTDAAREIVRRKLGIDVEVVEQSGRGADRALLAIVLADGRKAKVGRVNQLLNRDRVRDVIVSDFGVLVPTMKSRTWNEVARALVAMIVRKAEGDTDENEAVEWIRILVAERGCGSEWDANVRARRKIDLDNPEDRRRVTDSTFIDIATGGGWFLDATRRLWVYPHAIRQALVEGTRGLGPTLDVIRDRLKALGFEPEQIKSGAAGKTGTRQWWKAPDGFVIFEDDHKREGE